MPEKRLPNALNDPFGARDWLAREIAALEVARQPIVEIRYPKLLADKLTITELDDGSARCGRHKAIGHHGEYHLVIVYKD